jgi:hypothetical protein
MNTGEINTLCDELCELVDRGGRHDDAGLKRVESIVDRIWDSGTNSRVSEQASKVLAGFTAWLDGSQGDERLRSTLQDDIGALRRAASLKN